MQNMRICYAVVLGQGNNIINEQSSINKCSWSFSQQMLLKENAPKINVKVECKLWWL